MYVLRHDMTEFYKNEVTVTMTFDHKVNHIFFFLSSGLVPSYFEYALMSDTLVINRVSVAK